MNAFDLREWENNYAYESNYSEWSSDDWIAWEDARLKEIEDDFSYCYNRLEINKIDMLAFLLQNCEALVLQHHKKEFDQLYEQFIEWARENGVSWIPF